MLQFFTTSALLFVCRLVATIGIVGKLLLNLLSCSICSCIIFSYWPFIEKNPSYLPLTYGKNSICQTVLYYACMHDRNMLYIFLHQMFFFSFPSRQWRVQKMRKNVKFNENHQFLKSLYPPKYQYSGLSYEPGYEWQI